VRARRGRPPSRPPAFPSPEPRQPPPEGDGGRPRRRDSGEELLSKVVRVAERLLGGASVRLRKGEAGHRDRLVFAERADANRVEGARHSRSLLAEAFVRIGRRLRDESERASLHVRKERIEEAGRAARIHARVERLLERGKEPDRILSGEPARDVLNPPFELSDKRGAGVHRCGRRLEDEGRLRETRERGSGEGRLPYSVLAH
jgi:hypothetical protein